MCKLDKKAIFKGKQDYSNPIVLKELKRHNADTVICVYWPWILPKDVYTDCDVTINFHPALLPANKGWYPHVHNLINGDQAGVTLHQLAEKADTGAIWAQRSVDILATDTAYELYMRLQDEIVNLFIKKWPDIREKKIIPLEQSGMASRSSYNRKDSLDQIDNIELDKVTTAKNFINLLRARSFNNRGFAYFDSAEGRIYVQIQLSKDGRFKN